MSIALFFAFLLPANAQSAKQVQDKILYYSSTIEKWSESNNYDSLASANKHFLEYLKTACTNNTQVLRANFTLPEYSGIKIITSDDGNFRIYSWNTLEGGTMVAYNGLMQFNDGKNVGVKVLNDVSIRDEEHGTFEYGAYYNNIYTVKRNDGSSAYLVLSGAHLGGAYIHQTIEAFTIKNTCVTESMIVKTSKRSYSRIDIDCFLDANSKKMIHLNETHNKLYIPVIKDINFTDKYLVYVFDGNNYVFDKNAR